MGGDERNGYSNVNMDHNREIMESGWATLFKSPGKTPTLEMKMLEQNYLHEYIMARLHNTIKKVVGVIIQRW